MDPHKEQMGDEACSLGLISVEEAHKSDIMSWVNAIENAEDDKLRVPPVSIIRYRDLLTRTWGWERLLPGGHGSVDWDEFKEYLQEYMQFNATKVAHGKDALHAAVNKCIKNENKLLMYCVRRLTHEAISLSAQIKNHAKDLIESDVEYPAAAAALLCITAEAELMYKFFCGGFEITETFAFSTKVRQSASNLMFYKGPESAAAAGAMVGIATEAQMILNSTHHGIPDALLDYYAYQNHRTCIGAALTKLEQELTCKTTGNAGTLTDSTKKPMGFTTDDLNCEESCSMGNSKREIDEYCEKGEKKTDTTDEVHESTDAEQVELMNSENDQRRVFCFAPLLDGIRWVLGLEN